MRGQLKHNGGLSLPWGQQPQSPPGYVVAIPQKFNTQPAQNMRDAIDEMISIQSEIKSIPTQLDPNYTQFFTNRKDYYFGQLGNNTAMGDRSLAGSRFWQGATAIRGERFEGFDETYKTKAMDAGFNPLIRIGPQRLKLYIEAWKKLEELLYIAPPQPQVQAQQVNAGGASVTVLGRKRKVHVEKGKKYVTVHGKKMLLSAAKKLEKGSK